MTRPWMAQVSALAWLLASACAHGSSSLAAPTARPLGDAQLLEVASAADRLGDSLRAQHYLVAARRAGASDDIVVPRLIRLYIADGQYRLAVDVVLDRLRRRPQEDDLRLLLAGLYEALELEELAIEHYERVLVSSPAEPRAHYALGTIYYQRSRDLVRADQHFRAYLAAEPAGANAAEARSLLLKELP